MKNEFYELVETQIGEITRHKKAGVELPSQLEEIETFVSDPARYFITFTADLRPSITDLAKKRGQNDDNHNISEVRGRRKRKSRDYQALKGLPWHQKQLKKAQSGRTQLGQKAPAIPKFGINPKSEYNTPNGIYSYPLNSTMFRQMRDGSLPYAQDKPFFTIFEVRKGKNIINVSPGGESEDINEEVYEKYLDRLLSEDFFDNIASKGVAEVEGPMDPAEETDPKAAWKNYGLALRQLEPGDYTGIKDGFSEHFINKYFKPYLNQYEGIKRTTSNELALDLLDFINSEYSATSADVATKYETLSNFEIFLEDSIAVIYDWHLQVKNTPLYSQRYAATKWLFRSIMAKPEEWKGTEGIWEWQENLEEIIDESWLDDEKTVNQAYLRGYNKLTRVDLIMIKTIFEMYYRWKEESKEEEEEFLDDYLMSELYDRISRTIDIIDTELETGIGPPIALLKGGKGNIVDFLNHTAYDRIPPRETSFIKSIEDDALIKTWFGKLWAITRELADIKDSNRWSRIWRALGIDGIFDHGSGVIHNSEPIQAVFFSKSVIKEIKSFENKSTPEKLGSRGKERASAGKLRGQMLSLARKTYNKTLPKEYAQQITKLAGAVAGDGNMGLRKLNQMLARNHHYFPATDEDLKGRLEDENYKRDSEGENDRKLEGFAMSSVRALNTEELERVYKLGHLPLFDPQFIAMFDHKARLYDWRKVMTKRYDPLIDDLNDDIAKLWKVLKKQADGTSQDPPSLLARKLVTDLRGGMTGSGDWWRLAEPLKAAKEAGYDVYRLPEIVSEVTTIQVLLDSGNALDAEITIQTRNVSAVEGLDGPIVAKDHLDNVYNVLIPLVKKLISGELNDDNEALLKMQKNIFDYKNIQSPLRKSEPSKADALYSELGLDKPPWEPIEGLEDVDFNEGVQKEIQQYLSSKEILEEDENFDDISTEELLDPEKPAPWEKREQTT